MKAKKRFTFLEAGILALVIAVIAVFVFLQKQNVDAMSRDEQRKTAINTIYYALEEGFFKENGYYPEKISAENVKIVDQALWSDPDGKPLGDPTGSYYYEAANCEKGKCKEYTLKALLEKEDTFFRYNQN